MVEQRLARQSSTSTYWTIAAQAPNQGRRLRLVQFSVQTACPVWLARLLYDIIVQHEIHDIHSCMSSP